jgi:hypothetical protein
MMISAPAQKRHATTTNIRKILKPKEAAVLILILFSFTNLN